MLLVAVPQGFDPSRTKFEEGQTLLIITEHPDEVYREIRETTHHDATLFRGTGCYEGKEREMLYSVVSSEEAKRVVHRVREVDPHAFVNALRTEGLEGRFYQRPTE